MKILVAEDDPITVSLIDNILKYWGYQTQLVGSGLDALAALSAEDAPQMAILDWVMPGLSGTEICQQVRAHNNSKKYIYIILLTCKDSLEDVITGLDAGADDYITKPFNREELRVRLVCGERIVQQQNELHAMMANLKESEKLRDRFIAALTHDLRTPLNAQRMVLEILEKKSKETNTELHALVEAIAESNQGLLQLVNQMLEAHHLENESSHIQDTQVDLFRLVNQCLMVLNPLAVEKSISLHSLIQENTLPKVWGEPEHLLRVLTNLVGNAIQNIPEHCQVEVSGFERNGQVHIQVRDNGNGIAPERIPHLFDRYCTGIGNTPRKLGTGLGLSICKEIVERHGGTIEVESIPGHGCTFEFTLPVNQPPSSSQPEQQAVSTQKTINRHSE